MERQRLEGGAAKAPSPTVLVPADDPRGLDSSYRFARGLAGALSNSLSIILGRAQMVLEGEVDDRPALLSSVEAIESEAQGISSLVARILSIASDRRVEPVPVDLPRIVGRVVAERRRLAARRAVTIASTVTRPTECHGLGTEEGLSEALGHLVDNAILACEPGGNVTVALSVSVEPLPGDELAEPREWVTLEVADDGSGIAEADQPLVFEPFYTTRPAGEGLGLGLASVARATSDARGWLSLRSRLDEGTVIRLYIPRSPWPTASSSSTTLP